MSSADTKSLWLHVRSSWLIQWAAYLHSVKWPTGSQDWLVPISAVLELDTSSGILFFICCQNVHYELWPSSQTTKQNTRRTVCQVLLLRYQDCFVIWHNICLLTLFIAVSWLDWRPLKYTVYDMWYIMVTFSPKFATHWLSLALNITSYITKKCEYVHLLCIVYILWFQSDAPATSFECWIVSILYTIFISRLCLHCEKQWTKGHRNIGDSKRTQT